jgi:hypothetical protein
MSETESERRRRLINLGELIALLALIVSAAGVWIAWKSNNQDKPTRVVEQHAAVPLALRGTIADDGSVLTLVPADPSHALESGTVTIKGASPIEIGSDGRLTASDLEAALKDRENEPKDRTLSVRARIDSDYVEMGKDRRASGSYTLRYTWKGGGLFGGRSLRLVALTR